MLGSSHVRARRPARIKTGWAGFGMYISLIFFKPETTKRCSFARVTIGSPKRCRFDGTC